MKSLKKNTCYLLICLIIVITISIIISFLESKNIIFEKETWDRIITYGGFSLTLIGVIVTIWLYNYVTYEAVEDNVFEELHLTNKGLDDLIDALDHFINYLNKKNGINLNKQISTIKFYYKQTENNPKSLLAPHKKRLKVLVSSINRSGIGKYDISAINGDFKHKMIMEAYECINTIKMIQEKNNTKKGK